MKTATGVGVRRADLVIDDGIREGVPPGWFLQSFGNGQVVVTRADPSRPHFAIYATWQGDELAHRRLRGETGSELHAWLQGGPAPAWLARLGRIGCKPWDVRDPDGREIGVVGPFVPAACGIGVQASEEYDAVAERRYMVDCLLRGRRPGEEHAVPTGATA